MVKVYWWKQGENKYLKSEADYIKTTGVEDNGSSFTLNSVTYQDSGIYLCSAVRQGKIGENGNGSRLTVYAAPTPLKIVSVAPERKSSAPLTIVCETAAFHPEDFTLTWYKNSVETVTAINITKRQNTEGLFEISSSLEERQRVPSGTVYICLVSHISLQAPGIVTYAVTNSNPDLALDHSYGIKPQVVLQLFVGLLAILVLMGILVDHAKSICFEDPVKMRLESLPSSEQNSTGALKRTNR
ncbi:tapasin-related protein-like [Heptranchias perlo]|uniref:tapasin-related protein-like n=1 Tax=Heptranchias perlo TaxID=212740 RepID=UPI00355A9059